MKKTIYELKEKMDSNVEFRESLMNLANDTSDIYLDFKNVKEITLDGLTTILELQNKLKEQGNKLKLINVSPEIMDTIKQKGFIKMFPIELKDKKKVIYRIKWNRISQEICTELEKELMNLIADGPTDVVLDFVNVKMITSVGLRVVLLLKKKLLSTNNELKIINVNQVVLDILETTGYDKFIPVETVYRSYTLPEVVNSSNYISVEAELTEKLSSCEDYLYIDMSRTKEISFEGLCTLLKVDKRAAQNNLRLILGNPSETIISVMKINNFIDLFTIEY